MTCKGYAGSKTKQLFELYKEFRDLAAYERLVVDHLPLVRRLCKRFNHSGEPMEDLVQIGAIGLLKAIGKYDPARGSDFVAFAIPEIVGEIKNYFRDHGWAVKVPRKLQKQKMAVKRTVEVLTQRLSRSPTIPEIAEATGFSQEEVYDTFELMNYARPLSLDAKLGDNDGRDSYSLLDRCGSVDPQFERLEYRMTLVKAFDSLNEREKAIIGLKFYGSLSQTKVAERLGISQMHVSRLQRSAINKLRQNLGE